MKNLKLQKIKYFLIIKKTLNNIFCIVINKKGEIICYTTTGIAGFKGASKTTPYAAEQTGKLLGKKLKNLQIMYLDIFFLQYRLDKIIRDCLKGLYTEKIKVLKIKLFSKVAHNGMRLKKRRRK